MLSEPVLSLLRILVYEPLPQEEATRRFGRTPAEFEAALAGAGHLVRRYAAAHRDGAEVPYVAISPDGRQILQAV